jgi:hypothetical protein
MYCLDNDLILPPKIGWVTFLGVFSPTNLVSLTQDDPGQ